MLKRWAGVIVAGLIALTVMPASAGPIGTNRVESTNEQAATPILGTWEWERRILASVAENRVTNPDRYTITFNADGTYNLRADCNRGGGGYRTGPDNTITIEPGFTSLAACPPGSRDAEFLALLQRASSYRIEAGQLVLISGSGLRADYFRRPPPSTEPPLVGTTWLWERFDDTGEINDLIVPNPARYTLLLQPDGTLNVRADCNQVRGTWDVDGEQIGIEIGPSTRAFCGEDSLDRRFLNHLDNVATYVQRDGKLYLNLVFDSGNMVFRPS